MLREFRDFRELISLGWNPFPREFEDFRLAIVYLLWWRWIKDLEKWRKWLKSLEIIDNCSVKTIINSKVTKTNSSSIDSTAGSRRAFTRILDIWILLSSKPSYLQFSIYLSQSLYGGENSEIDGIDEVSLSFVRWKLAFEEI